MWITYICRQQKFMKQLTRLRYLLFSFAGLLLFTVSSCNKEAGMSLGSLDEDLGVTVVDSFAVNASTVQLEYLPTVNTGIMLVGKTTTPTIGATIASSYFRLGFTSLTTDIPDNAQFESVDLVLTPHASKYYYGDTLQTQEIYVHRLNEAMETTTLSPLPGIDNVPVYVTGASIFAHQEFGYDHAALGSLSFAPRINAGDTLTVSLDDAFGEELFDKIKAGDADVSSNDSFQQYLKGLVIVPGDHNTAILGLNDTVSVNINYTYLGGDGFAKTGTKTLTSVGNYYKYNNLRYDRSGTDFATLDHNNRELKSSSTQGTVYLQAGTGVVAKLDFPTLRQFLDDPNGAINKVELEIEMTGKNYGAFPNPNALILFIANKNTGNPTSFIRAPRSTSIQTSTMVPGDDFGKRTKYTFNLIDYVKTLNDAAYAETCLFLAVSSPNLFGTTNTAVIAKDENNQPRIKLNILYTKFK